MNPNNGATLEDCHSNFFALTDLCGIKWRRLVSEGTAGHGGHSHGPLDDPVLSSYARCLAADVLCVWRRAPSPKAPPPSQDSFGGQSGGFMGPAGGPILQPPFMGSHIGMGMGHGIPFPPGHMNPQGNIHIPPPNPSLNGPKELWIFWYGEEPDLTALGVSSQLLKGDADQGSWESGLSYECRTLLFKALHNLIERCLLARDFVRIGKWFIQPCEDNQKVGVKMKFPMQFSFTFAFFVHGESTVCMSVDVRQHPSIRRVGKQHLAACQSPNFSLPVLLAPHGLAGSLTGIGFRLSEQPTQKLLEEWKHFYPVEAAMKNSRTHPSDLLPPVVEVIVGGVRMRYPSCYVLTTEMDDLPRIDPPPTAPKTKGPSFPLDSETAACPTGHPGKPQGSLTPPVPRVRQRPPSPPKVEGVEGLLPERVWQESIVGRAELSPAPTTDCPWDFTDPTKKSPCTCSKCKRLSSKVVVGGSGSQSTKGGTKLRRNMFHKRISQQNSLVESWAKLWGLTEDSSPNSGNSGTSKGETLHPQRLSGTPGTPIEPSSYKGPSSAAPPTDGPSPASVAPSPLPTPKSQPASIPQQDPPMPTLSPQPPNEKPPSGNPEATAPKSVSSLSNQMYSPLLSGDGAKVEEMSGSLAPPDSENTGGNLSGGEKGGLRPPSLPSKDYEPLLVEEGTSKLSDIIYDNTSFQAWLNYPVKKMKLMYGNEKTTEYNWGFGMRKDCGNFSDSSPFFRNGPRQRDPYHFDDENHGNHNGDGTKRKERVKEEDKSSYPNESNGNKGNIMTNLFTIEGLQPHISDLDQMFDNSDSSGDEIFQAPTPPGSNKPIGSVEEMGNTILTSGSKGQTKGLGSLRPEELSKMFPTPPSHEHPIASPCGQPETPSMETVSDSSCMRRPPDHYPGLGSPPDEPIDDWTFVYKSPPKSKVLGSSKYASLPILPSQHHGQLVFPSPSVYKPSWQCPPTPPPVVQPPPAPTLPPPPYPPIHHPNMGNQMQLRPGLSPISPVPNAIRGPSGFDLGSPPNGNVYLKQGLPMVSHGLFSVRGQEAHALVVNLSLSDSVINLFRDHNFDSCTMCVCNAGSKVVGNIRGSEVGVYITDSSPEEDFIRCNCGFSASVNRRLAHRAGLFYEDEFEVTTGALAALLLPQDEWYEKKKPSFLLLDPKYPNPAAIAADKEAMAAAAILDNVPQSLIEMLRDQCLLLGAIVASRFTGDVFHHRWTERTYNFLDYFDGNRAAQTALEHGRTVMLEARNRIGDYPRIHEDVPQLKGNFMHKWPYLCARGPKSSQVMQVMRLLLPLLQDAVHAKSWESLQQARNTVAGPLTWRQFHRLAGRGTEDRCEPQPIPSILVGSEKDWVSLSPLAIKFWEKLLLEPYSYPRDVAYIVVAPDNDFILQKVRTFFRELSTMYEVCQLGRHCAISKILRDGILRVGKTAASRIGSEPVDEWFTLLPDIPTSSTLKLYAQVCRHYLAPQLAAMSLDQSILESASGNPRPERRAPSPKMPPPTTDSISGAPQRPPTPKSEYDGAGQEPLEDDERDPPALVIYLVEPFGFGSDSKDLHRMANLGLLRCFSSMSLPENVKNNITVQVVPLEDIMNLGNCALESRFKNDQLRALSLNVYSQCRRLLIHQNNVKSLTGFGPAAASEMFLKNKERKTGYKLYGPPFVLAPTKDKVSEGSEWLGGIQGHTIGGMVSSGTCQAGGSPPSASSVLYVSYCISEDHRWLLAAATDDRGELLETTCINIYIPNRSKRRKASARKHGLTKLMDFILGIMSCGVSPWRLVVGRVGRVGHGELESWSSLLSRKSLLRASNQLKDACRQCSLQYPADTPCVLSACLVSLEPDSCLRLLPDHFTPDERFGTGGPTMNLSTPQDISCTHILVFPTSATTQSSQHAFQEQHINGPEPGDDDLLFININEDMGDMGEGMPELHLGDIFNWGDQPGATSPSGSPRRDSTSQPGSPGIGISGRQSPFQSGGQGRIGARGDGDELGTLLQQPLALGYYVSTAPAGPLPHWFWASCPQRAAEKGSGVFLKSALHLHSHSVLHNLENDLLQQQSNGKQHPLDSQYTTDVLRFVLEGYNALSWLSLDPTTHDRKSCLPVHIQKLLQLYATISTLV